SALPAELHGPRFHPAPTRRNPFRIVARYDLWSGKRDSNPRPRAWKARALPTELFPQLSYSRQPVPTPPITGGEGRIRTSEGISRQIYSLLPLAAREPLRSEKQKSRTRAD